MNFYIGIFDTSMAKHFNKCFLSVNRLLKRKSDFQVGNWIMDSAAFTQITTLGCFQQTPEDYALQIDRWANCGNLELAVTQDYMCEPIATSKTGMTVKEHQLLTIERYEYLCSLTQVPIMPVLQGYYFDEYLEHLEMYGDRLQQGQRVGVGSICRRNSNPTQISLILTNIKHRRPDLRLHGFGLKVTALKSSYIRDLLFSADSMAWSYAARKHKVKSNSIETAREFYDNFREKDE